MKFKSLKSIFGSHKTKFESFIAGQVLMDLIIESGMEFIRIDKLIETESVSELLKVLRAENYRIAFHDNVHPTISDPGAYFSYSTEQSVDDKHWSMTLGNHGWSGGIYQIRDFIVARQIISLIKKEEITQIRISDVVFFSSFKLKSESESKKKGSEIQEFHRSMTTNEIINRISSKDSHQIWEAACEICSLGQSRENIKPLLVLTDKIDDLTRGINLGGAFANNSRFLTAAKKTLEFHNDSDACTCQLYGLHDCMNPQKEETKGFLKIQNIVRIEDEWITFYEAACTRCNQRFKINEGEGHYRWWKWERIN